MIVHPTCRICVHPERTAIERWLDDGWPSRVMAAQYGGFSRMSVSRHQAHRTPAREDHSGEGAEASVAGRSPYAMTGDLIKDLDVLRASIALQLTHLALRYLGRPGLGRVVRHAAAEAGEQAARKVLMREAEREARGHGG
jgi:hypothetical protein